jgi:hypothetical protein
MNNESERIGKMQLWPNVRYICLVGLRKTTKTLVRILRLWVQI